MATGKDTPQHRSEPEHDTVNPGPASSAFDDFDYSTPEAQRALMWASDLVLEIRREYTRSVARKVALYERTLGLAVLPVLLRRRLIVLARGARRRRRGVK